MQHVPIPPVAWANNQEIWQTMVYKEEATSRTRNCKLFEDPSSFLPRMRSILVDWIMEVCEVYRLRRMTFYLAVDYIDRYLSLKPATPKQHLQLVGISALFIAAKLEEIYPPKLKEFSYVCDGACSDEDILNCEILILNVIRNFYILIGKNKYIFFLVFDLGCKPYDSYWLVKPLYANLL